MPSGTTAVPAKPAAPRLAFLDGWRAIAVALVVTSHVSGFRHDPLLLKQIARWLPVGREGACTGPDGRRHAFDRTGRSVPLPDGR